MHVIRSACFTGHRPEKLYTPYDENSPQMCRLKEELTKQILYAVRHGCLHFYSGMAKGSDIIASELVLALKERYPLRHHAVRPYAGAFSDEWQNRANDVLCASDTVKTLQEAYTKDCFAKRNYYLVDHADLVIAVFNGQYKSGTWQTVQYAKRQNKEIHILHLEEETIRPEIILPYEDPQITFAF